MTILESIILGIVQGLGEFLPISSSGHLVLATEILQVEIEGGNLLFNILLHFGTLIAVFIAYWSDIWALIKEFFAFALDGFKIRNNENRKFIVQIIVATLPLFIVIPFQSYLEYLFTSPLLVGFCLIYTSALLFISDKLVKGQKTAKDATYKNALIIGIMQSIAIFPGVSRSGSTIVAGLFSGFSRQYAVKFSFIMSIPVILGANILEVYDLLTTPDAVGIPVDIAFFGILSAMISGILAIKLVKYITNKDKFTYFGVYTLLVGIITIAFNFIR